jgi:hypothetical protein
MSKLKLTHETGSLTDIRSAFYLEDVATEFQIQGLELDWTCVAWDGDLRFNQAGWEYHCFRGSRWQTIKKDENQKYLKNAYRVLLTRARQIMVLFVPGGNTKDHTRRSEYYNHTYEYLKDIGIPGTKCINRINCDLHRDGFNLYLCRVQSWSRQGRREWVQL